MTLRSWLIVPGNSEEALGAAVGLGADVIVVDLHAAVPAEERREARRIAADWLRAHRTHVLEHRRIGRWVRINPLDSGLARADLEAVMACAPDGIMLPRAAGPEAVSQLAAELYELEHRFGVPANSTRIVPVAGETPRAAVTIPAYLDSGHQRLAGLTWGAAALNPAADTAAAHDARGGWREIPRHVRAQALLTAHACMLMAIEAPLADTLDVRAIADAAARARADGFTGMLASHPDQVAAINAAFAPLRAVADQDGEDAAPGGKARALDMSLLGVSRRVPVSERAASDDPRNLAILRPA